VRVFDGISLQEGNTFYFGKGSDRGQAMNSEVWRYQVGDSNWAPFNFPVGNFWRAFSSKNYFGGGFNNIIEPQARKDFFRLENGTFIELAQLPFSAVVDAAAFELQGKLYLAGGFFRQEMYHYSPQDASWAISSSSPFPIDYTMLNFSYGSRQYFINPENSEVHAFDALTETWQFITVFPGSLGNGRGVAVAFGDKAYVGLGNRSSEMWELDLISNNWIRKKDFTGSTTSRTEGTFLWEGKIYFIRSAEVQVFGARSEFWVFDPFGF
jgi:N-acetylneuraminic acid mutarotase